MTKDIKVRLNHSMVARVRGKNNNSEWTNKDFIEDVRDQIRVHYGDRPVFIIKEDRLADPSSKYPDFYSAGWFVSDDLSRELVIVDHGSSFETARKAMLFSVASIDWNGLSKNIGE